MAVDLKQHSSHKTKLALNSYKQSTQIFYKDCLECWKELRYAFGQAAIHINNIFMLRVGNQK